MKRWISGILLVAVLLSALVMGVLAADADGELKDDLFEYALCTPDYNTGIDTMPVYEVTKYIGAANVKNVKIPDIFQDGVVVSVGANAFADASEVQAITLPNSIKNIGVNAFSGAERLSSITIPGGVIIGKNAFAECGNLGTVVIRDFVDEDNNVSNVNTVIGEGAFQNCKMLTSVTLPGSVETIEDNAFEGCTQLSEIVIPVSVKEIKSGAFADCNNLRYVTFLRRGMTIAADAFPDKDATGKDVITLIHCIDDSDLYRNMVQKYGEERVHGIVAYSEIPSGQRPAEKSCSSYDSDGTVLVTYQCEGIIETKVTDNIIQVPNVGTDGKPELDDDGNPKTHPEFEEIKVHTPCPHFTEGKNGDTTVTVKDGVATVSQTRTVSSPYHKPVEMDETETTCTEHGTEGGIECSICGTVLVNPQEKADDLKPHTYAPDDEGQWVTVKEATCTEPGEEKMTKRCTVCGQDIDQEDIEHKVIDPLGHDYDYGVMASPETIREATCTLDGLKVARSACTRCGEPEDGCEECRTLVQAILDYDENAAGGTGGAETEVPGTDGSEDGGGGTENAPETQADEDAAEQETPNTLIPPIQAYIDHLKERHSKVDNIDGVYYWPVEYEVIPAQGHQMPSVITSEITKQPTCTEEGEETVAGYRCTRCKLWVEGSTKVIPALGHSWLKAEDTILQEPTCTEEGLKLTGVEICVRDDCPLKTEDGPYVKPGSGEEVPIPALGHDWDDFVKITVIEEPTCKEGKAVGSATCRVCGEEAEDLPITLEPIAEHTWSDWEIITDPTGATPGVQKRVCSVCKEEETKPLTSCTTHSYGEWTVVTEPTATTSGLRERVCKICGHTDTEVIPATGGSSGGDTTEPPTESGSYKVSLIQAIHGSVSTSRSTAKAGDGVTLTIWADSGYELESVDVTRTDNGARISFYDIDGERYRFTMPASNVEVRVSFDRRSYYYGGSSGSSSSSSGSTSVSTPSVIQSVPRISASGQLFRDIPLGHWAAGEINWANQMGYMSGSGGLFNPDGTITFQQLWMVLARLTGSRPANMEEARRWAVNSGFAEGANPATAINRHQLVTALYRCARIMGSTNNNTTSLAGYSDSRLVPASARDAMAWAVANGIVGGTANGKLDPTGTMTRAQFAVILYRFSQRI